MRLQDISCALQRGLSAHNDATLARYKLQLSGLLDTCFVTCSMIAGHEDQGRSAVGAQFAVQDRRDRAGRPGRRRGADPHARRRHVPLGLSPDHRRHPDRPARTRRPRGRRRRHQGRQERHRHRRGRPRHPRLHPRLRCLSAVPEGLPLAVRPRRRAARRQGHRRRHQPGARRHHRGVADEPARHVRPVHDRAQGLGRQDRQGHPVRDRRHHGLRGADRFRLGHQRRRRCSPARRW